MDFVLESGSGEPDGLVHSENLICASAPEIPSRVSVDLTSTERDRRGLRSRPRPRPRPGKRSWPLRDPEEANLLRHFVDHISCFVSDGPTSLAGGILTELQFDCTDRQQHFAVHVPYRARYCDTLFNAVMAMSARHLSHTTDFDTFVSDHYYQACLETLIPALNDHGVTMDDDLLAATVILRLLEEFDGRQSILSPPPLRDISALDRPR